MPAAGAVLLCCLLIAGIPLANLVGKAGLVVQQVGDVRVRQWSAWQFSHVIASSLSSFRQELFWTLLIGALAATCAVTCGAGLAWLARRGGWRAVPALVVAAVGLAIPGPLIGLGVIWLLGPRGAGPPGLAVRPHGLRTRVGHRRARLAAGHSGLLVRAAESSPTTPWTAPPAKGAGGWSRFWLVALPQRRAGLAAVWLAVFAAAAGDLACSILVIPPGVTTVPIRVFGLIHAGVDDQVAGLCLVVFAGLAAVVAAAIWLLQRHERC